MIEIKLSSIFVDDQEKAAKFYTEKLGLSIKRDDPIGDFRWLTMGSNQSNFEMALEPNSHQAAKAFQKAIFDDGIPATMLFVDNMDTVYEKLKEQGVEFRSEPTDMDGTKLATFNDTCGNWILLCQEP